MFTVMVMVMIKGNDGSKTRFGVREGLVCSSDDENKNGKGIPRVVVSRQSLSPGRE